MHPYIAECLAWESMNEARAFAARQALLRQALADRPPLTFRLGTLLIRVGTWLRGKVREEDVEAKRVTA